MEQQESIKEVFGDTILKVRLSSPIRLTQFDVACEAGISERYYADLEKGKKCPSLDVVKRIAKAFDMTLLELITRMEGNIK